MECEVSEQTDAFMDIPPAGYPTIENGHEGEGEKPFSCPHFGCDGFTFDTMQECRVHEEEWHNPPYLCSECEKSFAAKPALKRHFKNSGHFNWICIEEHCEMKGTLFANKSEFVTHALNTPGHEHLCPTEALRSPVSAKRINYAEVIHLFDDENTFQSSPDEEQYFCPEPSCCRYQHSFSSESEFNRHKESNGHVNAIKYSETLRESGKSIADIMAEQSAATEFRCTAKGCPYFGEKLKSSQSFYHHINTAQHLNPPCGSRSNPVSPTAEIRMRFSQLNISCDEPECPKYEHRFSSKANYTKHTNSVAHLKAVSYGQLKRSTTNIVSSGQDSDMQKLERPKTPDAPVPSSEPRIWSRFTPISPTADGTMPAEQPKMGTPTKRPIGGTPLMTPPSSWREETLKKRNRELENELQHMHERIERMRANYNEQISSLFQTLGALQHRNGQ